ncbi:hypothetical protein ACIGMX_39670 [Streptomyces aquilus]|uniref:hypothetical protein n=1 Tax=Streptomyces aquilus TaxID=2548456 RepID=UPI001416F816|nr:hypothetical protein [Streptomyces aquilus]
MLDEGEGSCPTRRRVRHGGDDLPAVDGVGDADLAHQTLARAAGNSLALPVQLPPDWLVPGLMARVAGRLTIQQPSEALMPRSHPPELCRKVGWRPSWPSAAGLPNCSVR